MLYIGIDPGAKNLPTTGICTLKGEQKRFIVKSTTVYGKFLV